MYNDFLQNTLPQFLEDVDFATRQCLWMQQDGVLPHYARNVQNNLNQMFPKRWIERSGKLPPPRSSDTIGSNTLGFFLWGYLKSIMYQEQPITSADMRTQIRMACTSIQVMILMQAEKTFRTA